VSGLLLDVPLARLWTKCGVLRFAENDKRKSNNNRIGTGRATLKWGVKVGGMLDGVEDAGVAGAAAEVAVEAFLNLYQCGLRMFVEEMVGGEDHAGSADAALGSALLEEALLDGVEFFFVGEAFDGGDFGAFGLEYRDEAGVDEFAVHQDGAGAALAFAAAFLGSGEVKVFAEDVEEVLHGWGFDDGGVVVDSELDGGHVWISVELERPSFGRCPHLRIEIWGTRQKRAYPRG
jgi:hypothetical protein